jgi:hypothetical protein
VLAGAGLAIAAALIVLVVSSRGSSSAGQGDPVKTDPAPSADSTPSRDPVEGRSASPTRETTPSIASNLSPGETAPGGREMVREDGTLVRDHRKGDKAPPDLSASPATPIKNARVDPSVIVAVRSALRPVVGQCAGQYAADIQAGASLSARIGVTIRSEVLSVGKLDVGHKNLADRALADCVAEAARTLQIPAPGHEDVTHHMLTFPFDLPAR